MATATQSLPAAQSARGPQSLWQLALRALLHHRSAILGMIIIAMLILVSIFAPLIAPYEPNRILIGVEQVRKREAPCIHLLGCAVERPQHIMGVDGNVRDLFSRVIYGSRISLYVGLVTVGFAIVAGVILGALAGYSGGLIDNAIMRVLDVVLAFPSLLLAIAIVSVLGPTLFNAMMAIALVSIPAYARVMRASVLATKGEEYVQAARAVGVSPMRVLRQHIVQASLGIGTAILETAALSFLGLGAQPPTPEWGAMLSAERNQVFSAPHLVFFPGLAIMITVLGFNLLGDGLRDALDPRLNK
jgi:peptide/nickel transport system permease protein